MEVIFNIMFNGLIIVLTFAVITTEAWFYRDQNNTLRFKRQEEPEERWSWGFVDVQPNATETSLRQLDTEDPETTTEFNPCDIPDDAVPDFSASGRRICEKKCLEFIWQIKNREKESQRQDACDTYRRGQALKNGFKDSVEFEIGGRDALPGEFPHMAGIGWQAAVGTWIFKCGGSLISEKFVLTAAHCTRASPADTTIADIIPKIVRLGDKNIIDVYDNDRVPSDFTIGKIIVHPQYKSHRKYNDIALLELENPVDFESNLQPACLWSNPDTFSLGEQATSTGWGVVETATKRTSPILQVAVVDFIDSRTCDALLHPSCNRHWCGIQDDQICAGKLAGGVDACQGDSGGPLQVKINLPKTAEGAMHYLVGVTSFGFGCALKDTPGVYTRVSTFIDWIEGIVWP